MGLLESCLNDLRDTRLSGEGVWEQVSDGGFVSEGA